MTGQASGHAAWDKSRGNDLYMGEAIWPVDDALKTSVTYAAADLDKLALPTCKRSML
ncbi:hypothetical protein PF011_g11896 [Phytophthora fragariae]|uniref:Uncharacterized protein n=1 Tax=Phytophthora fragariae TaxID=53985 RepID=A0A6A3KQG8_9STRA|nr:hypothetical protein PF003_g29261 [Phytophthora fragariae]KAE9005754.1 hypothetical protein PF011_g11896 [Phytophthora fragariae]